MPRGRALTPVQQEQLIKSYEQSNLSKVKYCRQFGVSQTALYKALKKCKSAEAHRAGFCPVVIAPRDLHSLCEQCCCHDSGWKRYSRRDRGC
jgi:transposase-like protein